MSYHLKLSTRGCVCLSTSRGERKPAKLGEQVLDSGRVADLRIPSCGVRICQNILGAVVHLLRPFKGIRSLTPDACGGYKSGQGPSSLARVLCVDCLCRTRRVSGSVQHGLTDRLFPHVCPGAHTSTHGTVPRQALPFTPHRGTCQDEAFWKPTWKLVENSECHPDTSCTRPVFVAHLCDTVCENAFVPLAYNPSRQKGLGETRR